MVTLRHPVHVGPRDGSRFQPVIAVVDTAATYAVMPSPLLSMLGISPEWTSEFEMANGNREEHSLAEIRLRINDEERATICIFGKPDSQPLLGSYTLHGFGLAVDPATGALVPARLFLT